MKLQKLKLSPVKLESITDMKEVQSGNDSESILYQNDFTNDPVGEFCLENAEAIKPDLHYKVYNGLSEYRNGDGTIYITKKGLEGADYTWVLFGPVSFETPIRLQGRFKIKDVLDVQEFGPIAGLVMKAYCDNPDSIQLEGTVFCGLKFDAEMHFRISGINTDIFETIEIENIAGREILIDGVIVDNSITASFSIDGEVIGELAFSNDTFTGDMAGIVFDKNIEVKELIIEKGI